MTQKEFDGLRIGDTVICVQEGNNNEGLKVKLIAYKGDSGGGFLGMTLNQMHITGQPEREYNRVLTPSYYEKVDTYAETRYNKLRGLYEVT